MLDQSYLGQLVFVDSGMQKKDVYTPATESAGAETFLSRTIAAVRKTHGIYIQSCLQLDKSEAAAVKCDHSRCVTVSAKNLQLDHVSKALHQVQSELLPADAIVSRGAKIPPATRAASPNGKSRAVRAPNFHISTAMT